ncbi:MAG: EMC3/TMCO1 family protein, partial [Candidatus Thermoplasmatota archaeon]|nr:EMC3/TMCO1 family protein [Candidatus Thermoplasmatota archaeon]
KLMAMQPQVMVLQSEMMSNQMRPMMFTMMIAIPIIMWLRIFVGEMDHPVLSLPWEGNYDLNDDLWFLPHWILVYSALSLPFGQILMRGLKMVSLVGKSEEMLES